MTCESMDFVINNILNANSSGLRHVQICVFRVCVFPESQQRETKKPQESRNQEALNFAVSVAG